MSTVILALLIFLLLQLFLLLRAGCRIRGGVRGQARIGGSIVLFVGILPPCIACQICLPFPKESAADDLINADVVVFARENPEQPFSMAVTGVLKGNVVDNEIDLFLDSQSRRVLNLFPNRSLVCVFNKDGDDAGWRRIGTTDDAGVYESVIRHVLDSADAWEKNTEERVRYFSDYLGHEDDQLRTVAHVEVARAPYDQIRKLSGALLVEEIRAFLADIRYAEWHALYILLLAQSPAAVDREHIRDAMQSAAKYSINNQLAAWATALIEIEEADGLEFIERHYFANAGRKQEELKAVLAALSVQGTRGHTHLRDHIVAAYGNLLETRPELAPTIVGDLAEWKRWEYGGQVTAIADSATTGHDLQASLKLRAYVQAASAATNIELVDTLDDSNKANPISAIGWLIATVSLVLLSVWFAGRGRNQ